MFLSFILSVTQKTFPVIPKRGLHWEFLVDNPPGGFPIGPRNFYTEDDVQDLFPVKPGFGCYHRDWFWPGVDKNPVGPFGGDSAPVYRVICSIYLLKD